MPLKNYGVLKGRPVDRRLGMGQSPHYQIRIAAGTESFRIAVNVKSQLAPSEVLYHIDERFEHPICERVVELRDGFHPLRPGPTQGGMDYIRGNLFDPSLMVPLPHTLPGPDNDLNEKFDAIIQRAMADESAMIYAFGESWGPEAGVPDKYFGFHPGRGIHDIHMNQGNTGRFKKDNGVWQDGGLLVNFPDQQQWIGIFLAFQSQAWHTDDATGDRLAPAPAQPGTDEEPLVPRPNILPTEDVPDGLVRIVAALVNAPTSPEREVVTLLNTSTRPIDLKGWQLADKQKAKMPLQGELSPGAVAQLVIKPPVALSNQGGIITLLDPKGRKVHGVSYTKSQAKHVGWTLTF